MLRLVSSWSAEGFDATRRARKDSDDCLCAGSQQGPLFGAMGRMGFAVYASRGRREADRRTVRRQPALAVGHAVKECKTKGQEKHVVYDDEAQAPIYRCGLAVKGSAGSNRDCHPKDRNSQSTAEARQSRCRWRRSFIAFSPENTSDTVAVPDTQQGHWVKQACTTEELLKEDSKSPGGVGR